MGGSDSSDQQCPPAGSLACPAALLTPVLAGEVPKFFDNVLSKRAGEAVHLKGLWWDARRDAALEGLKEKEFKVSPAAPAHSRPIKLLSFKQCLQQGQPPLPSLWCLL